MTSRNISVISKISPIRTKPFGFHASLSRISEGPMKSLSEIAFAVEASIAAARLVLLIPPEPRSAIRPKSVVRRPSKNKAS